MVKEPAATPVTTPVLLFTVAKDVLLLAHTPPLIVSAKVDVAPVQMVVVPVISDGNDGTAITFTEVVLYAVPQLLVTV